MSSKLLERLTQPKAIQQPLSLQHQQPNMTPKRSNNASTKYSTAHQARKSASAMKPTSTAHTSTHGTPIGTSMLFATSSATNSNLE